MRRQASLFLVGVSVLDLALAHPRPVAAREIEAVCDGPGAQYVLGSRQYAQSFVPTRSGKLTRGFVETYYVLDQPATYVVEIWAADLFGLPTDTGPLASTTVDHPHSGYNFDYPGFASPPRVTAGDNCAAVVTVPNANNNGVTVVPGNVCATTLSLNQAGTPGGFLPDPNHNDLDFAVFVTHKRHRHHHH